MSGASWRDSPILLSGGSVSGAAAFSLPKIEGFEKRDGGLRVPVSSYRAGAATPSRTATLTKVAKNVPFPLIQAEQVFNNDGFRLHSEYWHTTGARIAGVTLPWWSKVLELARKAHRVIPQLQTICWDIGITPSGPVIVEGNDTWHPNLIQKPQGQGVWDGELGADIKANSVRRERQAFEPAIVPEDRNFQGLRVAHQGSFARFGEWWVLTIPECEHVEKAHRFQQLGGL